MTISEPDSSSIDDLERLKNHTSHFLIMHDNYSMGPSDGNRIWI